MGSNPTLSATLASSVWFSRPFSGYHWPMGPIGHTVVSTVIGASIWGVTGSPAAGGVALGVGVLVDIDHSVDYYQEWVKRRPHLVLKLFHAWEYSIIGLLVLGFIYYHPILLAATVVHLGHLALDHYHHRPNPLTYFISRRTWLRFDARKIEPGKRIRQSYEDFPNKLPLGRLWEPWYRRKIEPWFAARLTIAPEDRVDESDR